MARHVRIRVSGGWYHVFTRGHNREDIFERDADREHFLGLVEEMRERCGVRVHAYCRNHIVDVQNMLFSYALENLLKAHIVTTQQSRVALDLDRFVSGDLRRFVLFQHNLNTLAEEAQLRELQTSEAKYLFTRLTHTAFWTARYPAPTSPSRMALPIQHSFGPNYVLKDLRADNDRDNVMRAVEFIKKRLKEKAEHSAGAYFLPEAVKKSAQP